MMATTVRAAPEAVVSAVGVTKVYGEGETSVAALAGVDVAFAPGQFTSIMGPSGRMKRLDRREA